MQSGEASGEASGIIVSMVKISLPTPKVGREWILHLVELFQRFGAQGGPHGQPSWLGRCSEW
jgi:hypothetical protein